MTLVLDASAALTLTFGDERPAYASRLMDTLAEAAVHVPQHWPLEISNGLLMAHRRGRMSLESTARARELLLRLDAHVDDATGTYAWSATFALAERYRLTVYDAAYLELALRLDATLATMDDQLADAARDLGISVFSGTAD